MIKLIVGVIGLIAAYGAYRVQRWGIILTIIVMVLNVLGSLPGVAFAPSLVSRISSIVTVVVAGMRALAAATPGRQDAGRGGSQLVMEVDGLPRSGRRGSLPRPGSVRPPGRALAAVLVCAVLICWVSSIYIGVLAANGLKQY